MRFSMVLAAMAFTTPVHAGPYMTGIGLGGSGSNWIDKVIHDGIDAGVQGAASGALRSSGIGATVG